MNLWGHRFSQNANQKLQRLLPYPLKTSRAEISVIFGWHFGSNDDLINSFWIKLTFSILAISKNKYINKYLPGSCHIWVILVELSQVIQSVGHFTWLIPPFSLGCWLCWSLWKGHNKYRQGQKCPSYHNIQRAHSKLWKKNHVSQYILRFLF